MHKTHKSSADGAFLGMANGGLATVLVLGALFLISPAPVDTALAGPYPIPGADDDPNHCSGAKDQTVIYCVTPPAWAHCEEIMSESSPLYLGYRYECDPSPGPLSGPSSRPPAPANR
jgi:hypothetical protein